MAQRRASRGFAKVIDDTRWGGANHAFLAQGAGSVAQTMVTDGFKETILRIRGEIVSYIDGASAPGKLVEVGIGALVVQAGLGTNHQTRPISEPEAPWLFYQKWALGYEEMVTDVVDVPGITSFRKTVDSKAMRILREGREVQLVLEIVTIGSASSVNVNFDFRMLLGTH